VIASPIANAPHRDHGAFGGVARERIIDPASALFPVKMVSLGDGSTGAGQHAASRRRSFPRKLPPMPHGRRVNPQSSRKNVLCPQLIFDRGYFGKTLCWLR